MKDDFRDRLLLPLLIPVAGLAFAFAIAFGLSRILLAVTRTGAVITAIVVAATILGIAGLVATAPRIRMAQLVAMLGVVAGVALITGGVVSATLTEVEEGGPPGPPPVRISAAEGATTNGFDQTEVGAPAGVPFVIEFANNDPSQPHNVAVLSEEGGDPLFDAPIVTGPATAEYQVPPLEAGAYPFLCQVHPQTMTGTLTAEEGGGPGGGGEGRPGPGGGPAGEETPAP
jgi:plastocyanin